MSGAALGWAWGRKIPMSAAKFVLVAMADQTTTDLAFMSLAALCDATALDRKTVIASIARLIEWGLIEDTGERRGRTGQIPVYRLRMSAELFDNAPFEKHSKNGTVPKTVPVPNLDGNSTEIPIEQSQKRDTDPNQSPTDPTHTPRASDAEPEPQQPTAGALATRAMIEAGMPVSYVNPSAPKLLAALAEGVTLTELADVTRQLGERGTGPPTMNFVIATALGRRRDEAVQQDQPHAQPGNPQPERNRRSQNAAPARSAVGRQLAAIHRLRAREGAGSAGIDGAEPAGGGQDS